MHIILEDISLTIKHIHTFATPFIAWAMALFDRNVWKKIILLNLCVVPRHYYTKLGPRAFFQMMSLPWECTQVI